MINVFFSASFLPPYLPFCWSCISYIFPLIVLIFALSRATCIPPLFPSSPTHAYAPYYFRLPPIPCPCPCHQSLPNLLSRWPGAAPDPDPHAASTPAQLLGDHNLWVVHAPLTPRSLPLRPLASTGQGVAPLEKGSTVYSVDWEQQLRAVMLEGGCQAHRVGYFGSAMICKKLLPEIESK